MTKYRVTVAVSGTEYYEVEAESEDEAWDDWYDGKLLSSENDDYEVVEVEEQ